MDIGTQDQAQLIEQAYSDLDKADTLLSDFLDTVPNW